MPDQPAKPDPDERTPAERTEDARRLREELRREMEERQRPPERT